MAKSSLQSKRIILVLFHRLFRRKRSRELVFCCQDPQKGFWTLSLYSCWEMVFLVALKFFVWNAWFGYNRNRALFQGFDIFLLWKFLNLLKYNLQRKLILLRKQLQQTYIIHKRIRIFYRQFPFRCRNPFYFGRTFFPPFPKSAFTFELFPIVCMQALDGVFIHVKFPSSHSFSTLVLLYDKKTPITIWIKIFRLPEAAHEASPAKNEQ